MGAGVIDCMKSAVDVKQGDGAAVQCHFFPRALGDFVRLCGFVELTHGWIYSSLISD